MATTCIGIGSNLGDREAHCREAIARMEQADCRILKVSTFIETEPWGLSDQPLFLNGALTMATSMTPEALFSLLKVIEKTMGRQETVPWGPRIIDLDILLYDDLIVYSASLTIPHPCLHERLFALQPLAEIAPNARHPVFKKTIRALLEGVQRA
ncbi:MAG TPA: 2-amino-4-hydroxy-6-hydroxymethyldihydropteridine diphosphokinase [Dissulfurispiraceae bacterium]|nr:2-amino-4-hydroxy-6-hydroxymethyldihydropteridine diphosphokinase [Dissulfurispiraceae bacterium]